MITDAKQIDYKRIKTKRQKREEAQSRSSLFLDRDERQKENIELLEQCRRYWDSLEDYRKRRRRNRKYNRGDQWSDKVWDPNKKEYITEEEYIKSQGKVPLKQNLFRMILKNLLGQFRGNNAKSVVVSRTVGDNGGSEMLTNAVQHVHQLNYLDELDARQVEEFALGGIAAAKLSYDYYRTRNEEDIKQTNLITSRLFFNTDIYDIRGEDIRLIGEIIDTTLDDLVGTFAKTPEEEEHIKSLYRVINKNHFTAYTGLSSRDVDTLNFYIPEDTNKVRMFEVWQLESEWRMRVHDYADGSYSTMKISQKEVDHINAQRIQMAVENGIEPDETPLIEATPIKEQFWTVKYLTPHGYCLFESETPYEHEEHPYILLAYPLIDGEVWGFMEDIIDQQRYVNRMIIMMDFIMSAAAKGVLMIPEDQIPTGWTPEQFAEEWRSFNGVILYKPSKEHNQIPQQISANSTVVGLTEMLQLQMNLINDVSGIHSAIQGKSAGPGTPASLYAQEAQNAATNTLDFFHTFGFFQQRRDEKVLKLILQYYKEDRYFAIAGERDTAKLFQPSKVKGKMYDLVVTRGVDTPAYKQMIDETLYKLLEMQMIDVEIFLENSSLPYNNNILEAIRQKKQQAQNGQMPDANLPIEADPNAMAMLQQAAGK